MKERIVFNHTTQELKKVDPKAQDEILIELLEILNDLPRDGE
jgi:hypothetical protein